MDDRLPGVSHYFDERPGVPHDVELVDVALPSVAFTIETDRGVFARGRLDAGTGLLLREAPAPSATGHLLDLGCGSGAIALTLAKRSPAATVWAVDINERARQLTERNAARNGVHNIVVAAPDEVPPEVRLATIWSNPPIRIGKQALHELLLTWLARLEPRGESALVVQKHLGADSLQNWLAAQGYRTQRIASRAGYRLLKVHGAV
jgi:16S rRNA (guanine1207-N2)-methyltransferase